MVAVAKQRMSLLIRSYIIKDPFFLMIGFRSFILPLVEYCSPAWSPYLIRDILLIESVQRIFTKRIPVLKDLTYTERINFLCVNTLEHRRLISDLIMCYKIMHGLMCGPPEEYGLLLSNRRSRGHSLKLQLEQPKMDVRKFYFANRVARPWNSLPDSTVNADNVKSFKSLLSNFNLKDFLLIK